MGMREEFEAWVSGRKVVKKHGASLNQTSVGSYSDYRINDRWMAWQASRAALVVELPGDIGAFSPAMEGFDEGISYARVAIEAAGVTVK